MPNRLAAENNPYLLEHADNPVDWHPWGAEALARAKADDRPIFLSIGYSACHWCHVMARESFADPRIAALLNERFVCIKVDREERPDLDAIYMNAVQLMTGRGGWPMSVFLTPDGRPFYGGTYWPPQARMGMPGFDQVIVAVGEAWQQRRAQVLEQADTLTGHVHEHAAPRLPAGTLDIALLQVAARAIAQSFDETNGGFGGAPKFPHPMDLRLLLRCWKREPGENLLHMVLHTLDRMAAGGIYDQLGGGFHRYSVDEHWIVPHFEKMLYDNALLIPCYVEVFQVTRRTDYARVARESCDYVLREMTLACGGFASTQDADSDGEEGKFFVWTPAQIEAVLGADAARTFCQVYDVSPEGNFEHGASILHVPQTLADCAQALSRDVTELEHELRASRAKLLAARESRIHPHRDDKVIVSWNGLMIEALALAAGALDEPRYLAAAQQAGNFLLNNLRRSDGRLLHSWRNSQAQLDAYLDDYAGLAAAMVALYEADFDERWFDVAISLADTMLTLFADRENGGFYFTSSDHEQLIARQKDFADNAVPSGNSMAAVALLRLGLLTGRTDYLEAAERTLQAAAALLRQAPRATPKLLAALDLYFGPTPELVLLGDATAPPTATALASLRQRYVPNKVVACRAAEMKLRVSAALDALFAGKQLAGPEPALYVCQRFACQAPVHGLTAALGIWDSLGSLAGEPAANNASDG